MAKLTSAKRNSLPSSTFVFPKTRKFPINDPNHARNALSRAGAQGGAVQAKVKAAVKRKFPSIGVSPTSMIKQQADRTLKM